MKFLPRAITTLRNLSFTLQGNWLGNWLTYFCLLHLVLTTIYHYLFILDNVFGLNSDPNLHFVEAVALKPPEVTIDMAMQQQWVSPFVFVHFIIDMTLFLPGSSYYPFNLSPQFEVLQELIHFLLTQAWSWACCSGCTTSPWWRWWSDWVERIMNLGLEQELCLTF